MILSLRDRMMAFGRLAGRLRRDVAGNTLAIVAAAVIPLMAMVGSGVDMSRVYMVKSRLQQACDAGALAGRRAMTGPTLDTAAETQARNLFNFNFPAGTMGTTNLIFDPHNTVDGNGNPSGQVTATATATVPTAIMRMFGKETVVVDVECDAKLEIANTDVMFVLDVTGSMNCAAGVSGDCGLVEQPGSKIEGLRNAVVSFYNTLNAAADSSARLRFGFVPYSTTVNVGALLPTAYLTATPKYQSRERRLVSTTYGSTAGTWPSNTSSTPSWSSESSPRTLVSNTIVSGSSACVTPATTYAPGTATAGTPTSSTNSSTGVVTTTTPQSRTNTRTTYYKTYTSSTKNCKIEKTTATRNESTNDIATATPTYTWDYKQITPGTFADYKASITTGTAAVTMTGDRTATNGPAQPQSSVWAGCIEERQTVAQTTFTSIPSTAYDMDIDRKPDSEATRWTPSWPQIIWDRNASGTARPDTGTVTAENTTSGVSHPTGNSLACPKAAQKLNTMTLNEVKQYLNVAPYDASPYVQDFKGAGYTYHDTGMIWGARLISPTGIFDTENATAPNGKPINRHIVFMTDGDMMPNSGSYGLYGIEDLDGRVGNGTTSDLLTRHNNRFVAMCNAARAKNITIWVVAFANALNTELTACADPGKAFTASNDAQLLQQFQLIAQRIARLRLSK